jgi:hypothetical protein
MALFMKKMFDFVIFLKVSPSERAWKKKEIGV